MFRTEQEVGGSDSGTPIGAPSLSNVRQMFDGEYTVTRRLGWSPSAAVYQGERDGRCFALAVLPIDCAGEPDRRDRFERAARELAWQSHPGLVPIRTYGVIHDIPWVEWSLVEGRSLAEQLELGPLSRDRALGLAHEVLEALAASHANGVTHGDLSPGQVLLTEQGIKLVGSGLASIVQALGGERLPARNGRQTYLAPEVIAGARPDARSDVYSVGALIYHMFLDEAPPPPPAVSAFTGNPMLPADLEPLLVSALAPDPKQRFASAEEMMREITHALGARRALSSRPPAAQTERSRARYVVPAALAALLALGGVGYALDAQSLITGSEAAETVVETTLEDAAPDTAEDTAATPAQTAAATGTEPAQTPSALEAPEPIATQEEAANADEEPVFALASADALDELAEAPTGPRDALASIADELVPYRERVRRGERLARADLAAIYEYSQEHADEVGPHLLLAEAFMDLGWHTDAIERFSHAYRVEPESRHHPMVLESLILLSYEEWTALDAADALVTIFGTEALPAIDAAISSEPDEARVARFQRLRDRLARRGNSPS